MNQLKAQELSRSCNNSKEEDEEPLSADWQVPSSLQYTPNPLNLPHSGLQPFRKPQTLKGEVTTRVPEKALKSIFSWQVDLSKEFGSPQSGALNP